MKPLAPFPLLERDKKLYYNCYSSNRLNVPSRILLSIFTARFYCMFRRLLTFVCTAQICIAQSWPFCPLVLMQFPVIPSLEIKPEYLHETMNIRGKTRVSFFTNLTEKYAYIKEYNLRTTKPEELYYKRKDAVTEFEFGTTATRRLRDTGYKLNSNIRSWQRNTAAWKYGKKKKRKTNMM